MLYASTVDLMNRVGSAQFVTRAAAGELFLRTFRVVRISPENAASPAACAHRKYSSSVAQLQVACPQTQSFWKSVASLRTYRAIERAATAGQHIRGEPLSQPARVNAVKARTDARICLSPMPSLRSLVRILAAGSLCISEALGSQSQQLLAMTSPHETARFVPTSYSVLPGVFIQDDRESRQSRCPGRRAHRNLDTRGVAGRSRSMCRALMSASPRQSQCQSGQLRSAQ